MVERAKLFRSGGSQAVPAARQLDTNVWSRNGKDGHLHGSRGRGGPPAEAPAANGRLMADIEDGKGKIESHCENFIFRGIGHGWWLYRRSGA